MYTVYTVCTVLHNTCDSAGDLGNFDGVFPSTESKKHHKSKDINRMEDKELVAHVKLKKGSLQTHHLGFLMCSHTVYTCGTYTYISLNL